MDVVDISKLRSTAIEQLKQEEVQEYINSQHRTIEKLCKQVEVLKEKNNHLEKVLQGATKGAFSVEITQEELICIEQIEMLKARSSQRELTTDDIKKLDLLIKNLKLLRQESTVIMSKSSYKAMPEEDLLAIAESLPNE